MNSTPPRPRRDRRPRRQTAGGATLKGASSDAGQDDTALRHYSPRDIDAIIETAPGGLPRAAVNFHVDGKSRRRARRGVLAVRLEEAAEQYFLDRCWANVPLSTLKKQFSSIESACKRLLKSVGQPPEGSGSPVVYALRRQAERTGEKIGGYPNHPPESWQIQGQKYVDYQGVKALQDAIQDIRYLEAWSNAAKAKVKSQISPSPVRHSGDEATINFFNAIVEIWTDIFDKGITTSIKSATSESPGEPTGPMIRFAKACLAPLDVKMTDHQIRERIRPHQRKINAICEAIGRQK